MSVRESDASEVPVGDKVGHSGGGGSRFERFSLCLRIYGHAFKTCFSRGRHMTFNFVIVSQIVYRLPANNSRQSQVFELYATCVQFQLAIVNLILAGGGGGTTMTEKTEDRHVSRPDEPRIRES